MLYCHSFSCRCVTDIDAISEQCGVPHRTHHSQSHCRSSQNTSALELFNSSAEPCFTINAATNVENISFRRLVTKRYLVYVVYLREGVEFGVHRVEQRDDLHRQTVVADVIEADHSAEHDRHRLERLQTKTARATTATRRGRLVWLNE